MENDSLKFDPNTYTRTMKKADVFVIFLTLLILNADARPILAFYQAKRYPKSFSAKVKSLYQVERKTLMKINVDSLVDLDKKRNKNPKGSTPLQFAVAEKVGFNLNNSGQWDNLSNGRIWRLRIYSPGALSHNIEINHFTIPAGAELWIYNPTHKNVAGPFTSQDGSLRRSLWTPIIEGDEIVIEVFIPAGAYQAVVEISTVNKGYRN
jgi:lysyl endopeptidase